MIRDTFQLTGRPASEDVVEVLLEPHDGNGWIVQLARWCAHRGEWIHEWTRRPIIDSIVGWRERTRCALELAGMQTEVS
ncbi:hypothetical protein DA075_06560 [Methylobacterium currus]|uniref:Uncharacterized protein n=1 Tax=Methylobacterium currus TaxID=2051553 RepID=A0A2R4WGF8_9HYPH|nr:hypothetical protein [Methylobacterium currus]AWB20626.1 hypothetical protein DA075_06560 [Methylobacterium currus]